MKEQIRYINQSIDEKRNRLKEKVDIYFATIPSISVPQINQQKKGEKNKCHLYHICYMELQDYPL